jgi:type IV secretory pathway VirB2 component (pilin)
MRIKLPRVSLPVMAATFLLSPPAWAQSGDWAESFVNILDSLNSGFGRFGLLVVAFGVIAVGLWAAATGRMDWNRMIYVVIGGICITVGPTAILQLLGAE